jgi:dihydroorotate dehydrogenase (NAD+) catalytic subunit
VLLKESVAAARGATAKPIWAKLSPEVSSIVEMADICRQGGANAVTLINTFRALALDPGRRHVILGNATGGLSGPAIRPLALAAVWDVAHAVNIDVVGVGGIATTEDALMFLMAGARAIQVGTASFRNPLTMVQIIQGLAAFMAREAIDSLDELIGCGRLDSAATAHESALTVREQQSTE